VTQNNPPPEPDHIVRILSSVDEYYSGRIREHGATPRGADWRDSTGQQRRFDQLLRQVDLHSPLTIAEIGCGYGALAAYLAERNAKVTYIGCDISEEMIKQARSIYGHLPDASFVIGRDVGQKTDYVVASGIFNVRFAFDDTTWFDYVVETIDQMLDASRRGVAVNFLTGFADSDRRESRLWYQAPGQMLDFCIGRYGHCVSLFHDYGMYEFTLAINTEFRKQS
jgi:SAM-dependent methyltransferase